MDYLGIFFEHGLQLIELISAGILLIGFGKASWGFVKSEWGRGQQTFSLQQLSHIRLQLGTYILLGLDLYIVSDIIHSMIYPEFNELINLALIVVMRTTIGYFLGKEIAEIQSKDLEETE